MAVLPSYTVSVKPDDTVIHTRTGFMKETPNNAFPFIKIAEFQSSPGLKGKLEVLLAKAMYITKT